MDAVLDWLKVALTGVRQSFLLVLFGGVCLVFIRREWWPLHGSDTLTAPVAGIMLFWGASSLLVHLGSGFARVARRAGRNFIRSYEVDAEREREDAEASANLELLTELEIDQLLYVLRAGQPRFRELVINSRLDALLIFQRASQVENIWQVRPSIWQRRNELLQRWAMRPRDHQFPTHGGRLF